MSKNGVLRGTILGWWENLTPIKVFNFLFNSNFKKTIAKFG